MEYSDEKINYTHYLADKPQETDPAKVEAMYSAVVKALKKLNVHGHISCVYYKNGCVKVSIDYQYYNVFDSNTGKFFSGYVGDRAEVTKNF